MKYPKISFVTPMKEQDFRVVRMLQSIRYQNYPPNKIEIIIIDGGSNPKVLEECKKYKARIYYNPKQLAEGAGMGKDQGIWKCKGEFIVISESDIEYIEKNWIRNMIKPFKENKDIFASVPRLLINKKDNYTNRYLSYVGVDPFAMYRALDAQLELNKNPVRKRKEPYFILKLDEKRPYCMGSNGFMFKKSIIEEAGDYAQDIEFIARISKLKNQSFAVVENAHVWHKNVKNIYDFIRKRVKWTRNYTRVYIKGKKEFNWVNDRSYFLVYVIKNILLFPNIPISIKKASETKDPAWLIHAPMLLFSTALNIYFSLTSMRMLKQTFKAT